MDSHNITTFEAHLGNVRSELEDEASVYRSIHEQVPKAAASILAEAHEIERQSEMHGVDYAKIDSLMKDFVKDKLSAFAHYLERIHDRVHEAEEKLESAEKTLKHDFSGIGSELPSYMKTKHEVLIGDLEAIDRDDRFIEKRDGTLVRVIKRMAADARRIEEHDIALAQEHHRVTDKPLEQDTSRLMHLARRMEGVAHAIAEKARLANQALVDAIGRIDEELEGIEAFRNKFRKVA